MIPELIDQHIVIVREYITELEQFTDPKNRVIPSYLPVRIADMMQIYRTADGYYQGEYLNNILTAIESLPKHSGDLKYQKAILFTIIADLDAHAQYLANKRDELLKPNFRKRDACSY